MLCTNLMSSTEESISELLKNDDGGPVCMVNLLKFKKKARYEDGRETSLTGPEAYQIYGEGVAKMVNTIGGSIVFSAVVNGLVVGEVEELWDAVAIAEYPSRQSFADMISSAEWSELAIHRSAGLAGLLNISSKKLL